MDDFDTVAYVIGCIGADTPKALKEALEDGAALGEIFGDRADELQAAIEAAHHLAKKLHSDYDGADLHSLPEQLLRSIYQAC